MTHPSMEQTMIAYTISKIIDEKILRIPSGLEMYEKLDIE